MVVLMWSSVMWQSCISNNRTATSEDVEGLCVASVRCRHPKRYLLLLLLVVVVLLLVMVWSSVMWQSCITNNRTATSEDVDGLCVAPSQKIFVVVVVGVGGGGGGGGAVGGGGVVQPDVAVLHYKQQNCHQ